MISSMTSAIDCLIIGAGPAGLAAAVQATRLGLTIAIIEQHRPGGQALAARWIEDYPGFPGGISGHDLMALFIAQAKDMKIDICHETARECILNKKVFKVKTNLGVYHTHAIIVATGLIPKRLKIDGESKLIGRRIFSYADPNEIPHKGKCVLVVGGGDAAFDQALYFSRQAKNVIIAMHSDTPRCLKILEHEALNAGVDIMASLKPEAIHDLGDSISFIAKKNYRQKKIKADILITCIGKERKFDFLPATFTKTAPPGLFFAGDCDNEYARHIAIAVGGGTKAAKAAAQHCYKKYEH